MSHQKSSSFTVLSHHDLKEISQSNNSKRPKKIRLTSPKKKNIEESHYQSHPLSSANFTLHRFGVEVTSLGIGDGLGWDLSPPVDSCSKTVESMILYPDDILELSQPEICLVPRKVDEFMESRKHFFKGKLLVCIANDHHLSVLYGIEKRTIQLARYYGDTLLSEPEGKILNECRWMVLGAVENIIRPYPNSQNNFTQTNIGGNRWQVSLTIPSRILSALHSSSQVKNQIISPEITTTKTSTQKKSTQKKSTQKKSTQKKSTQKTTSITPKQSNSQEFTTRQIAILEVLSHLIESQFQNYAEMNNINALTSFVSKNIPQVQITIQSHPKLHEQQILSSSQKKSSLSISPPLQISNNLADNIFGLRYKPMFLEEAPTYKNTMSSHYQRNRERRRIEQSKDIYNRYHLSQTSASQNSLSQNSLSQRHFIFDEEQILEQIELHLLQQSTEKTNDISQENKVSVIQSTYLSQKISK
jgi:hypothetical protein